ncbi:hypothetical protein BJX64DRAFT_215627 [Aspergillus heterothallicus]
MLALKFLWLHFNGDCSAIHLSQEAVAPDRFSLPIPPIQEQRQLLQLGCLCCYSQQPVLLPSGLTIDDGHYSKGRVNYHTVCISPSGGGRMLHNSSRQLIGSKKWAFFAFFLRVGNSSIIIDQGIIYCKAKLRHFTSTLIDARLIGCQCSSTSISKVDSYFYYPSARAMRDR